MVDPPANETEKIIVPALKSVLASFGVELGKPEIYRIASSDPDQEQLHPMQYLDEYQPENRFFVVLPLKYKGRAFEEHVKLSLNKDGQIRRATSRPSFSEYTFGEDVKEVERQRMPKLLRVLLPVIVGSVVRYLLDQYHLVEDIYAKLPSIIDSVTKWIGDLTKFVQTELEDRGIPIESIEEDEEEEVKEEDTEEE